jgi:hypothetical protein
MLIYYESMDKHIYIKNGMGRIKLDQTVHYHKTLQTWYFWCAGNIFKTTIVIYLLQFHIALAIER